MKFEKGVYWKVFSVFSTLASINITMFFFGVFGFNNIELLVKISGIIGIVCGFASTKLIEKIPYDEDDNYDMLFFFFIILLIILIPLQSIYFHN